MQGAWQFKTHVLIVGGGIVGCMTAMELVNRGYQVTIVERNQIAAQTSGESSWAGAGIVFPLLPWMYRDEVNQLAQAGATLYLQICEQLKHETGIDPELTQSGMLIKPTYDLALAQQWCENNQFEYKQLGMSNCYPVLRKCVTLAYCNCLNNG